MNPRADGPGKPNLEQAHAWTYHRACFPEWNPPHTGGQYEYKMVQIPPDIDVPSGGQKRDAAATYLESIVNRFASQGWEFHRVDTIGVKRVVGVLLLVFAAVEVLPRFRNLEFDPRYLPLGGAIRGCFGGLSGMQGALRSDFLFRAGLSKEAFIGTGVVVACLVEVSRLTHYSGSILAGLAAPDYGLLTAAVIAAFLGAFFGNRYLKMTMKGIQRVVAALLFAVALGLIVGLL